MTAPFRFKQFTVNHHRSGFKVGTDGVLLGAVVPVEQARHILDIGTGCGLIALMIAQRSIARITGIDIDGPSIEEALLNAEQCPWKDRVSFFHSSLHDFSQKPQQRFDRIVSNPPFFHDSLRSPSDSKNRAKHNLLLDHTELLDSFARLLSEDGEAWIIIPSDQSESLQNNAMKLGFTPKFIMTIYPIRGKKANRCILGFSFSTLTPTILDLYIRNEDHTYTEEYKEMTKEYYLEF